MKEYIETQEDSDARLREFEAVKKIAEQYDVYILSTVPWSNKTGASDKIEWIKTYFGDIFRKKVCYIKIGEKSIELIDFRA